MTPKESRDLRDEIKRDGLHCVIPRGGSLPTIYHSTGPISFVSRDEWLAYKARREKRQTMRSQLLNQRSPIDKMIDESCGITWEALRGLEATPRPSPSPSSPSPPCCYCARGRMRWISGERISDREHQRIRRTRT